MSGRQALEMSVKHGTYCIVAKSCAFMSTIVLHKTNHCVPNNHKDMAPRDAANLEEPSL